jgi:folylpolyglutamate synthase/dihydropteroate synthase
MLKDKDHLEFMKSFEGLVKSVTLIDIPNQDSSISKEEFQNKIKDLKLNLNLSSSIKESIQTLSKNENTITLCVGSLYLVGEILNLN